MGRTAMRTGTGGDFLGLALRVGFRIFRGGTLSLIIGLVKTGPFENNAASGPDEPLQFKLLASRTFLQTIFTHGLQYFKIMAAMGALVLVSRHIGLLISNVVANSPSF